MIKPKSEAVEQMEVETSSERQVKNGNGQSEEDAQKSQDAMEAERQQLTLERQKLLNQIVNLEQRAAILDINLLKYKQNRCESQPKCEVCGHVKDKLQRKLAALRKEQRRVAWGKPSRLLCIPALFAQIEHMLLIGVLEAPMLLPTRCPVCNQNRDVRASVLFEALMLSPRLKSSALPGQGCSHCISYLIAHLSVAIAPMRPPPVVQQKLLQIQADMTVFVKTPSGKYLSLRVKSTDTVEHVFHGRLLKLGHRPTSHEMLYFSGIQMEKGYTLANYNVRDKCVLQLRPTIQIIVVNTRGEHHPYLVLPTDTVEMLKYVISSRERLPFHVLRLMHNGKRLEDGYMLLYYKVADLSNIQVFTNKQAFNNNAAPKTPKSLSGFKDEPRNGK